MNINIFNGYQSTVPAVIKFQQMVDIIRGDKQLAELTKRYRITHQREYKSQCYCFSVTCVFQGGKAKKDIIEVTGVGFSDFDHVPKEKLAELCAKLREDSHTLFFHITASGEGLRVLYRYGMKPGMTLEEQMKFYPTAFRHGNQYFSDLLGVEYDEHCCNLGRLMGAAYDPEAFFRPDAEPFSYDWLVARQQEKTLQDNATARLRREVKKIDRLYDDKLAKELEHEMKTYVAGSKNEYVSCLAYKLNAFGFSADAALEFICQEFPDYERPKAAVDSCYRQTEEHGKRKHELQNRRHEAGKSASVNDIIKFLGEHVELRYNQITMRVEYRMKVEGEGKGEDSSAPGLWQIINDRAVNTLWSEMSKTNRAAVQDFFRVIESNYVQPFNPFIDYLGSLPEWHEGDTDYIQQLADSVTIKGGEEQQKLWTCYLRKWLVGDAGWMDARRRGKQCNHRIDRRTGLRQEHLDSHGVAARTAPVFLHQDQRQPPLQGRLAGARHLRSDALRGAGHDEALRAEPAEGCRYHAHYRRACCLRPLPGASPSYSLVCRHRQQRSVPLRSYGQSSLAALRGREHPVAP